MLISADTDFGELLAVGRGVRPSVVLFRGTGSADRRALLLDNIDAISPSLVAGAVVVISGERIRIRGLPLR